MEMATVGFAGNAQLKIDAAGLDFIESWEAYVGYWYDDKVAPYRSTAAAGKLIYREYLGGPVKGTLTIGIGHTNAACGHWPYVAGGKISHDDALKLLAEDLSPCQVFVLKVVKVALNQGQFDALVSFVYNCGEGAFNSSSILRKLNAGDYTGACAALELYDRSKGEVMKGLQRRRAAEQHLFNSDHEMVAASDPRISDESMKLPVPKADESVQKKSIVKSTEAMSGLGQVAAGTIGVGKAISDHMDTAIDIKHKAEDLGIEPMTVFGTIGPLVEKLFALPMFWVFLVIIGLGIFTFFRRRSRLISGE